MDLHKYEGGRQYTVVGVNTCGHTGHTDTSIYCDGGMRDKQNGRETAWDTDDNCREKIEERTVS